MTFEYCVTELPESTSVPYKAGGIVKRLEQRLRKDQVRTLVPPPGEHWELVSFTANDSTLFMVWRREVLSTLDTPTGGGSAEPHDHDHDTA